MASVALSVRGRGMCWGRRRVARRLCLSLTGVLPETCGNDDASCHRFFEAASEFRRENLPGLGPHFDWSTPSLGHVKL